MTECVRCGRQLADGALVCAPEAQELADVLLATAGHAEDAETVIARQARYGTGGSGTDDPMPVDLSASAKLRPIENTIRTWARLVVEERGTELPARRPTIGPLCAETFCEHGSCQRIQLRRAPGTLVRAAAWLATQVEWLRHHSAADEAFAELHAACEALARLVDRPPVKDLVGMCDCGRVLYAIRDRPFVTCPVPTCKLRWNVTESRDILRAALDDKLVTAADAARLGQYLDSDRTQKQIRKLVNKWIERGLVEQHGKVWREPTDAEVQAAHKAGDEAGLVAVPTYRFGDVAGRLARTPRRAAAKAADDERLSA